MVYRPPWQKIACTPMFRALANSPDLNQGPSDLQSDAVPTELSWQLAFIKRKYNPSSIYDIYIICCLLL